MLTIKLDYGFEIRIDRYNHTLVKKQLQFHRNNSPASVVKQVVGYYPNLRSCIDRYLSECQLSMLPDIKLSLKIYAEFVQQCNADTAAYIIKHIEEYCKQNQK